MFYNIFDSKSERISGLGSLEFQATDQLKLYVDGLYSRLEFESNRQEFLPFFSNSSQFWKQYDSKSGRAAVQQLHSGWTILICARMDA